jgi:hypothetical protein
LFSIEFHLCPFDIFNQDSPPFLERWQFIFVLLESNFSEINQQTGSKKIKF